VWWVLRGSSCNESAKGYRERGTRRTAVEFMAFVEVEGECKVKRACERGA
jgi:hypothetical protein